MKYFLLRRVHTSWLIAFMCVGIFVGVVASAVITPGWFNTVIWLLTGTALCLTALWQRYTYLVIVAVIGGGLIGLWRGSVEQSALHAYDMLYGKSVTLVGTISDDADVDKRGNTVLRLKNVAYQGFDLPGTVWTSIAQDIPVK